MTRTRMEWQPIETAPQTGQVLLYWPETKVKGRSTLYELIRVGNVNDTPHRPPTHWMPLPEPPA
jgi:hypothetical protein